MGKRLWLVPLFALALAWASVIELPGPNQNAHLALVTAITHGTPRIDPYERWTRDDAWIDGHFYTAKAPGLALFTVPYYLVLKATGLLVHGPPYRVPWPRAEARAMPHTAPWQVALWGAALPFFLLLVLVRTTAERLVPGYGTAAAVTLGAGSLAAVFATLFFDHELSALLGFAAFAVLFRDRRRHAVWGGLLGGLAVDVEFPLALVALVLLFYARDRLRYALGVAIGIVPLLAFNTWAGGRPWSLAYSRAVIEPGRSGHDVIGANSHGFFGLGMPSLHALVDLLLTTKGLLVLTPVWALAAYGLVVLWRHGARAESAVAAAVTILFLLYNAAYYLPFGGFSGGPRFLVPMMPFLALGVAAAWRELPGPTLALALASIVVTTASILADPMLVSEDVGTMFHRIERGGDVNGPLPSTVLHWLWSDTTIPLLLVAALVGAAVLPVLVRRLTKRQALLGLAALAAWRAAYTGAPILTRASHHLWPFAVALALVLVAGLALAVRGRYIAAAPALLALLLVSSHIAGHPRIAAAIVTVALAGVAAVAVRLSRAATPAVR
ncbi:MAG: hypothetical protein ACJ76I_13370 [Gaiellaceae bacterium]